MHLSDEPKLKCKYEHAAIYIGAAQIMEANGAHVVMIVICQNEFRISGFKRNIV